MIPEEEVEPPQKKTKLPPPLPPPLHHQPCHSFSSLPDDLAVNCLARIPRWYYPKFSLVSKTFRSLISSRELHAERSQIGTTEICLYMCLKYSNVIYRPPSLRWFSLWVKPKRNRTDGRTKEKSSGNMFVPFPNHSPPPPYSRSTLSIGSEIYFFGAPMDDDVQLYSSAVRVYDCLSHTWRVLPNMKMERVHALSCVFDDKIYVMGGCRAWFYDEAWFEMFDIKTHTWKTLPANPERNVRLGNTVRKISGAGGKIYVKTANGKLKDWIYDVKESKWSVADGHLSLLWSNSWCVIDNVMYSYTFSKYMWYDLESRAWGVVTGLAVEKKYRSLSTGDPNCMVELVNYGGKLAIVWDRFGRSDKKKIWCAVVALERSHGGRAVWGKIEWADVVLTVPKSYDFLRCLTISV